MLVYLIAMVVIIALAMGVIAMVALASNREFDRSGGTWHRRMRKVSKHLNGEAPPPQALRRLVTPDEDSGEHPAASDETSGDEEQPSSDDKPKP